MFALFDDSSTVCAPEELGSFGSRIRTMYTGEAYERRVKLIKQNCLRRLAMVADANDWDRTHSFAFKRPRQTITGIGLGSGMSSDRSDGVSMATSKDGKITVMYKGEFRVPAVHTEEDAHSAFVRGEDASMYQSPSNAQRMLDFYQWSGGLRLDRKDENLKTGALNPAFAVEKLRQLGGGYAFILYDRNMHRIVVARDMAGREELYWGVGSDGEEGSTLMFSTQADSAALAECSPSATLFPKGTVLLSQGGVAWRSNTPGLTSGPYHPGVSTLHSFAQPEKPVRAVPRINSSGMLCGAVFRVESVPDLATAAGAGSQYVNMPGPPQFVNMPGQFVMQRTPSQIELFGM